MDLRSELNKQVEIAVSLLGAVGAGSAPALLHKPQCDLDPAWEEEHLDKATVRTISLLHEATVGGKDQPGKPLDAPGFCYIFPLLKLVQLRRVLHVAANCTRMFCVAGMSLSAVRASEGAMLAGLGVVSAHAAQRSPDALLQPALFPTADMFRTLIDLVGSTSGRVQAACTVALLETGEMAARAHVTRDDVVCLLAGLQSPQEVPEAGSWAAAGELFALMLDEVQHPAEPVQRAAAAALAQLLIPAKLDQFGHVVEEAVDEWGARRGAALALHALAPHLRARHVPDAMRFFVERGLADRADPISC
ncbi:hypothetical protein MSG28_003729 [Choristoneura fumiferana]|uniref:Uncharacterized protein n=1 Tax=Choristoneura fumiferana TaxID=7141 RepID=A0ACC0KH13_CHOFU|nr:hypothetical protein MSG28_003729 [Choristoneura fumiferana]